MHTTKAYADDESLMTMTSGGLKEVASHRELGHSSSIDLRIGVDTGGTFTDFVCFHNNRLLLYKCRSTPEDPSRAILEGIAELSNDRTALDIVHGSTIATNAVLERKGAQVALLATKGFEDVNQLHHPTSTAVCN